MRLLLAAITALTATAAAAQDTPSLDTIVTESIGYFNLAPGQVIVEGNENQPNRVCAISATDAAFAAVATGGAPEGLAYDCFTLAETGNDELSALLDDSIGYFNLRPGVFVIEAESGSVVCQMNVSDAYMAARRINDIQAQADNLPGAVCIALSEFEG